MKALEESLLSFIQEELGIGEYAAACMLFDECGIESFQVLEIVLEIERQRGERFSIRNLDPSSMRSLESLLQFVQSSSAA